MSRIKSERVESVWLTLEQALSHLLVCPCFGDEMEDVGTAMIHRMDENFIHWGLTTPAAHDNTNHGNHLRNHGNHLRKNLKCPFV